jgi:archaellum component FlaC
VGVNAEGSNDEVRAEMEDLLEDLENQAHKLELAFRSGEAKRTTQGNDLEGLQDFLDLKAEVEALVIAQTATLIMRSDRVQKDYSVALQEVASLKVYTCVCVCACARVCVCVCVCV